MNTEDINTEFQDNTLRCEKVYPLFAFADASLEGHKLVEEILDYDESLNKALGLTDEFFNEIEGLHKYEKSDEIEAFLYEKGKLNGYLAKFAKPVITKFYEDKGFFLTKIVFEVTSTNEADIKDFKQWFYSL